MAPGWLDCTNEHAETSDAEEVTGLDRCRRLPNHKWGTIKDLWFLVQGQQSGAISKNVKRVESSLVQSGSILSDFLV